MLRGGVCELCVVKLVVRGAIGVLEAAPEDVIRQQFEVNLFGLIEVTKAVLPSMRARKSGVIINVSSVGGRVTFLQRFEALLKEYFGQSTLIEVGLPPVTKSRRERVR